MGDITPESVDETATDVGVALRGQGWRQYEAPGPGFAGTMHPRYRSHVPLSLTDHLCCPLEFFQRLWRELRTEDPERIQLYLASYDGQVHAAALRTRVGNEFSYTHGASPHAGRVGLLCFELGLGADAVEMVGEWGYPLRPV